MDGTQIITAPTELVLLALVWPVVIGLLLRPLMTRRKPRRGPKPFIKSRKHEQR